MKDIIKLYSRYEPKYLYKVSDNPLQYELKTLEYLRIGFKEGSDNECTFIDPSGGPMLSLGDKIEGLIIKNIYSNGIIEFEKDEKE